MPRQALGTAGTRLPVTFSAPHANLSLRSACLIAQEAQYRDWMLAALAGDAGAYRMLLAGLTRHLRSLFRAPAGSGRGRGCGAGDIDRHSHAARDL